MDTAELNRRVNWLDAVRLIQLVEGIGMAVHDSDTIGSLREIVRQAALNGDIRMDQIDFINPSSTA